MLHATELTWSGQKGVEGEYQCAIDCMAKSTLGAFRSTPQGILAAESGLVPARALLGHRQARFVQRLHAGRGRAGSEGASMSCPGGTAGRARRMVMFSIWGEQQQRRYTHPEGNERHAPGGRNKRHTPREKTKARGPRGTKVGKKTRLGETQDVA